MCDILLLSALLQQLDDGQYVHFYHDRLNLRFHLNLFDLFKSYLGLVTDGCDFMEYFLADYVGKLIISKVFVK